jgi:hypothetical protein
MPNALTEALTSAATQVAVATFANALSQGIVANDALTGGLVLTGSLGETIASGAAQSSTAVFPNSRSEALTAADTNAAGLTMPAARSEALAASDAQTAGQIFSTVLAEAGSVDVLFVTGQNYDASLGEGIVSDFSVALRIVGPSQWVEVNVGGLSWQDEGEATGTWTNVAWPGAGWSHS